MVENLLTQPNQFRSNPNSGWIYRSRQLAAPLEARFGTNFNRDRRSSSAAFSQTLSTGSNGNSSDASIALVERVGGNSPVDSYSFSVTGVSNGSLKVRLFDAGSLTLSLARDRNNNGRIDAGEILSNKRAKSGKQSRINLNNLAVGNYIFQISSKSAESKEYSFSLAAKNINVQGLD